MFEGHWLFFRSQKESRQSQTPTWVNWSDAVHHSVPDLCCLFLVGLLSRVIGYRMAVSSSSQFLSLDRT